jgi:hypothetical protein
LQASEYFNYRNQFKVNYNLKIYKLFLVFSSFYPNSTRPPLDVPGTSPFKLRISSDGPYRVTK